MKDEDMGKRIGCNHCNFRSNDQEEFNNHFYQKHDVAKAIYELIEVLKKIEPKIYNNTIY